MRNKIKVSDLPENIKSLYLSLFKKGRRRIASKDELVDDWICSHPFYSNFFRIISDESDARTFSRLKKENRFMLFEAMAMSPKWKVYKDLDSMQVMPRRNVGQDPTLSYIDYNDFFSTNLEPGDYVVELIDGRICTLSYSKENKFGDVNDWVVKYMDRKID